ncbi:MAG: HD domain-containing protein, partial [Acidimicrobiales bacterium]
LSADADPGRDPSLALRAAAVSAEIDRPLARGTLDRLEREASAPTSVWPDELRRAWLRLLGAGPPAVGAIEALDRLGIWVRLLPEWGPVRNRPQRNAYHRFTVDRHLVETAVGASAFVRRVRRPDLLLAGALLHDIGKGRGGDHTEVGIAVVERLAPRLGFDAPDTEVLVAMVRHHLLLPDVATRRDLDDPATIVSVAAAVGDGLTLELLAFLTEADSRATGPSAWGPWKAGLVTLLVERVAQVLAGERPVLRAPELTAEQQALLDAGELAVVGDDRQVTVVAPDQPGLLAAVTGVLTLSGVLVRSAATRSEPAAELAVLGFEVTPAFDRLPDWARVRGDLEAVLGRRLPLAERLDERERHYSRRRRPSAAGSPGVTVTTDNAASAAATVLEVRAPDTGPVLYRIADAVARKGLFITWARVATLGAEVVDVFYVQSADGSKLTDGDRRALEASVTAALT